MFLRPMLGRVFENGGTMMKRFLTIFLTLALLLGLFALQRVHRPQHWILPQKRRRPLPSRACRIPARAMIGRSSARCAAALTSPSTGQILTIAQLRPRLQETNGVLSKTRLTEYARVILGLTAIGENPRNVAGYNLLAPLADYDAATQPGSRRRPTCCWRSTAEIIKFRP